MGYKGVRMPEIDGLMTADVMAAKAKVGIKKIRAALRDLQARGLIRAKHLRFDTRLDFYSQGDYDQIVEWLTSTVEEEEDDAVPSK